MALIEYEYHPVEMTAKGVLNLMTRAGRNNNPGNLRYAGQAGATGQDPQGFAIFATAHDGWNALYRQIELDASRGQTLKTFIYAYAPPTENSTANYLSFLMKKTGASADTPLSDIDTQNLAEGVAHFEGYYA